MAIDSVQRLQDFEKTVSVEWKESEQILGRQYRKKVLYSAGRWGNTLNLL